MNNQPDKRKSWQMDVVYAYSTAACGLAMLVSLFAGAIGPGLAFLALGLFFWWRSENTS
jgi:hypothetical protein